MTVPGPRFRDQLVKRLHESVCEHLATNGMPHCDEISQEIERLIAAEVESRVQAAANQRAAEELDAVAEELLGVGDTAPSRQQVHLAAWLQATADNLRAAADAQPGSDT